MRVLITGGSGFIGSHLAIRCAGLGWETTIVDREVNLWEQWKDLMSETGTPFTFIQNDMISPAVLDEIRAKKFDIIFHLAAVPRVSYSVEHPAETTDENILKSVKLLEAAQGNCFRFIFASSSSVYGGADVLPTPETYPLSPKSPYALQKRVVEDFCRMFGSLYEMDTVCLRYFNVFGERQLGNSPYSTALSAWCHAIKHNLPLRKDGTGQQSRDMTYVANVVEANIRAALSWNIFRGEAFNVACGDKVSNNEILAEFERRYPILTIREVPFRPGDVMHSQADISLITKTFDYAPVMRFWEGFERTLRWWNL